MMGIKTVLDEDRDEGSPRPCQGQGLNILHTTLGVFTGHLQLCLILTLWDITSSVLMFVVDNSHPGYRNRVILCSPSLQERPESGE